MSIVIENIVKKFGRNVALDGISFHIPKGVFGFVGKNGSGKTTLLRILATLLPFDQGNVKIYDFDIPGNSSEIRKRLGYLPQKFDFFPNITVQEAMEYFSVLKYEDGRLSKNEIEKLLATVGLSQFSRTKIKALSGGMKQRLGIAQSLIGNPKIIILDEPTASLDPVERLNFSRLINTISRECIIIFSTHNLSDIQNTCENVAVLDDGKLLYSGSIRALLDNFKGKIFLQTIEKNELADYEKKFSLISVTHSVDKLSVRYAGNGLSTDRVDPTLEDVYYCITQHKEATI